MDRVIDASFAGLSFPRRTFAAGRSDMAASERPGAVLMSLISKMTRDGKFDYEAVSDPGRSEWVEFDVPRASSVDRKPNRFLDDEAALDA